MLVRGGTSLHAETHNEPGGTRTLAIGGRGRGEDFTPSGRPPMSGWSRPRTTRLELDASVHDLIVAARSTRRALTTLWMVGKGLGLRGASVLVNTQTEEIIGAL